MLKIPLEVSQQQGIKGEQILWCLVPGLQYEVPWLPVYLDFLPDVTGMDSWSIDILGASCREPDKPSLPSPT